VRVSATSLNAFSQAMQLLTFPIDIINQNKRACGCTEDGKAPMLVAYCVFWRHQQKGAH